MDFIFCVEGAEGKILENLRADPWWKEDGGKFLKIYPMQTGEDDSWYKNAEDKEAIKRNFARLGRAWFEGVFNWKRVLLSLARTLSENGIEWYVIGSASEAALGVDVVPHDLDIAVHTRDFYRVKGLFSDSVIEPFVDNKGTWLVRYFGKLCVDGASIDIVADEKMNRENHEYDSASWNGFDVWIEPLRVRYQTELQRDRVNRIKAIEAYMGKQ